MKRIHFEDHGQDILWWDVDEYGEIVDYGPYGKGSLFYGSYISYECPVEVGGQLAIGGIGEQGELVLLKFTVNKIEELKIKDNETNTF